MDFTGISKTFTSISSLYELRRVLEVTVGTHVHRVELFHNYLNDNAPYSARVYVEGKNGLELEDFPWVEERTEDDAIHSALTFLEDRAAGRS